MPDSVNFKIFVDAAQAQASLDGLMLKLRTLASTWDKVGQQRGFIGLVGLERQMRGVFDAAHEAFDAVRMLEAEAAGINIKYSGEIIPQAEFNRIERNLRQIQAQGERAAYGITTAFRTTFATIPQLEGLGRRISEAPRQPVAVAPTSARRESEYGIQAAITQHEMQSAGAAEAVADAKRLQAAASMAAAQAVSAETAAMVAALVTEHEMVTAANALAAADRNAAAARQARAASEAALASAMTEFEVNATANAEALAAALTRQAAANKLANEEIARQTEYQRQALATQHEMISAANAQAAAEESRRGSRMARVESEASLAAAGTESEVNAAANAEAAAEAKTRLAAANKLANEELARQTQYQVQALATEHEMNAAASLEAQQMAGRIASQRAYAESVDSVKRAMEGEAAAAKYAADAQRAHMANMPPAPSFWQRIFGREQATAAQESALSLGKASTEFDKLNGASTRATRGMRNFHGEMDSGSSKAATWTYAIRKFITEFDELMRGQRGQMISTFGSAIRDLGFKALPVLAPIAAAFAAIKLERLVSDFGKLAEETINGAAAAGMSVENYSLLQRTLQVVGGDANTLSKTFALMSQSIERALTDPGSRTGGAWETLLGPSARTDLTSMLNDNAGALTKLRDVWNQMGPTLQRTEVFRAALGRGFQELVPILNMSNDEFATLESKVRATGSVMDATAARSLAEVAHSTQLLNESFVGLGLEISKLVAHTSVLDFFTHIIEKITETIKVVDSLAQKFPNLAKAMPKFLSGEQPTSLFPSEDSLRKWAESNMPQWWVDIEKKVQRWQHPPEPESDDAEAARHREYARTRMPPGPPPGTSVLDLPIYPGANKLKEEMDKKVRLLHESNEVENARLGMEIAAATARDDRPAIQRLEQQRIDFLRQQIQAEQAVRAPYAEAVEKHAISDEELAMAKEMRNVTQAQRLEYDLEARSIEKNAELNRKAYEEDIALLKARVQAAHGNIQEITDLYRQMLDRTRQMPGGDEKQYQEIARSYVEAMRSAQSEAFSEVNEFNSASERLDKTRAEQQKAILQTQVYAHQLSKDEMYQREAEFTSQLLGEEERRVEAELQTVNLTSEQRERLYDHLAELYEKDADNQLQAQERITQAIEKENEKREKAFKDAFDTLGSGLERAVEGALSGERGTNLLESLRKGLIGSITKGAFEMGSQFLGSKLGPLLGVETKGMTDTSLGSILSKALGKLLGLEKETPEDAMKGVQEKLARAADAHQHAAKLFDDAGDKLKQAGEALLEAAKTLSESGTVHPGGAGQTPSETAAEYGAGRGPLPGDPKMQNQMYQWLKEHGYTMQAASAVIGNAMQESGLRPGIDVGGQLGMFQWTETRRRGLEEYAASTGRSAKDWQVQMEFMDKELQQINPNFKNLTESAGKLAVQFRGEFERPAKGFEADPKRAGYAEQVAAKHTSDVNIAGVGGTPTTSAMTPGAVPTSPAAGAPGITDVNVKSSVPIQVAGVPGLPGTQSGPAATPYNAPGYQFGGPVGTDTALAWLTPGERVLTLEETAKYHRMFPSGILRYQGGGLAGLLGIGSAEASTEPTVPSMPFFAADPFHPVAQAIAGMFGQPTGEQFRGLFGAPDPDDPDDPRRPRRYQGGGLASHPGLTSLTTEARGFAPFHLVQSYPGLGKGWGLLAGLLGAAAALGGLAWLFGKDDQEKLAKKLLEAPETDVGEVTKHFATPLDPSKLAKFHSGGVASDEMLAVLQAGERVIPRYQSGGMAVSLDPSSPTYSPAAGGGGSTTSATKELLSTVTGLSSDMAGLAQDVSKVASGFMSLERGTNQQTSATQKATSGLSSISGAFEGLKGIISSIGGMFGGGGGSGGGGFLDTIGGVLGGITKFAGLFALFQHGGVVPSAAGGWIIPRFQGGGILSMLHANEMVLPAHISQMVQNAANNNTGGASGAPDIHFHLHTIDQRSGAQFLMSHRDTIAGLYRSAYRNFNINVPM